MVKVGRCQPPGHLFRTSSLAMGVLLGNVSLAKGMFLISLVQIKIKFCVETQNFGDFGPEEAKSWQFLSRKCKLMALLM